ncbi:MAG: DUF58 domain-containing protein [Alcanivoracaceae bacterium]|nr:DUF58 domain-containing protein [Alcanivoracaceae bacterium]
MKPESLKKSSWLEMIGKKFFPNLMLHRKVENLPLLINWRRVFILPTKPGLFFAFVTFLMLVASLNFNNNMGLMMTFLLVGLGQVALYQVFFNLKSLIIDHVTVKPVFLGKEAEFIIHFKASEAKYDICINNKSLIKGSMDPCLIELPADELHYISYKMATSSRGWLTLGKIKVLSSYPFGLFFAWIWTNIDARCLVYPRPETSAPPLPIHAQSDGETSIIKQGEDFHGLKPFQSGDSMRLIAWKRTAQTGELISREFQQTHGEKLLLDYSQIPLAGTEEKLSRLTAWVLMAYQQQLDYCLQLPQFNSGYGYSSKHHLSCLKELALFALPKTKIT